eukprot:Gb_02587 [translate_table: standard]
MGILRKRERENPCEVCGHYHKYLEGEKCTECGHVLGDSSLKSEPHPSIQMPTEILTGFLFLGSYHNATRLELLKLQGIKRLLNTWPACKLLENKSFEYHTLKLEEPIPFNDACDFIEQCRVDQAPVLVHCISGIHRSPAIVIAYLMRHMGWRLDQSYEWVRKCRPSIHLLQDDLKQLKDYEAAIFGARPGFGCPNTVAVAAT